MCLFKQVYFEYFLFIVILGPFNYRECKEYKEENEYYPAVCHSGEIKILNILLF